MFAEASLGSGSSTFPTYTASVENSFTLYVQGMKLIILDEFHPETLLSFLICLLLNYQLNVNLPSICYNHLYKNQSPFHNLSPF